MLNPLGDRLSELIKLLESGISRIEERIPPYKITAYRVGENLIRIDIIKEKGIYFK